MSIDGEGARAKVFYPQHRESQIRNAAKVKSATARKSNPQRPSRPLRPVRVDEKCQTTLQTAAERLVREGKQAADLHSSRSNSKEKKTMVGPFGETDEIWERKQEFSMIASILFTVFTTSVPLAPFERKFKTFLEGDIAYYLSTGLWTLSMLFVAFAWWLGSNPENLDFGLRTAFYASLVGTIVFNVCWATLYFLDSGAKKRYLLALFFMFLGWGSAVAALIVFSINVWRNWAVITAVASAIITIIFLAIHILMMIAIFVYFYSMQGALAKITLPIRELLLGRARHVRRE
jgi:hypothetical protein